MRYYDERHSRSSREVGVMSVGFIGLGVMGAPMASNLVRAGLDLVVWNRSEPARDELAALGATVAATPVDLFARCDTVLLMLAHETAIDLTLMRHGPAFADLVADRTLVHLGTTSPEYSERLARDVRAAGGRYVEAPVSGSRVPAERGELVGLAAGEPEDVERVAPLLAPMCGHVLRCGPVPLGLRTKLAVNLFLITMVTGLAEAYHFADAHGLDLDTFRRALDVGPMASAVSRIKLDKLVRRDYEVQAAVTDVHTNNRLIAEAARRAAISTPLLDASHALFRTAERLGLGEHDMVAVVQAIAAGDSVERRSVPAPTGSGSG
jgi:3-hydroxyisobutyrate dehydrogenase